MARKIITNSNKSKVQQLVEFIIENIRSLSAGAKCLSERALCKQYGVSLMTARRALQLVALQGQVYRIPGKGTFVSSKNSFPSRRQKETGLIAFVATNIKNPFFSSLATAINKSIQNQQYQTVIYNTNYDPEEEARLLREFRGNRKVDGIIITPTITEKNNQNIKHLQNKNIPVVFIARQIKGIDADYVVADNFHGAYNIVKHLINLGHQRIGYLSGYPVLEPDERLKGYKYALSDSNLDFKENWIERGNMFGEKCGYEAMQKILSLANRPTAVFAYHDIIAIGALRACKDQGIRVPGDMAIVGFDNLDIGRYLEVPLTTVDYSLETMGSLAVKILFDRINGKVHDDWQRIFIQSKLVIRQSCGSNKHYNVIEKNQALATPYMI